MTLERKKIAILIAPRGTEELEFKTLKDAVEAAGATVTVVGIEASEAKTNNGDLDPGDKAVKGLSGRRLRRPCHPGRNSWRRQAAGRR